MSPPWTCRNGGERRVLSGRWRVVIGPEGRLIAEGRPLAPRQNAILIDLQ